MNPVGFLVLATSYSRTAYRRTTIGAAAFHCRVRNGNGWGHCASVTRNLRRACRHKFLVRDPRFEIRDSWFGVIPPNYDSRFTNFDSPTIHSSLCQRTADSLISTYGAVIRDSLHRYNGFPIHDLTL